MKHNKKLISLCENKNQINIKTIEPNKIITSSLGDTLVTSSKDLVVGGLWLIITTTSLLSYRVAQKVSKRINKFKLKNYQNLRNSWKLKYIMHHHNWDQRYPTLFQDIPSHVLDLLMH